LLIVFMVTSTAIVKASLRVDLPKAASGGSKVESTLNLVLPLNGPLELNGQPVASMETAGATIRREATANPKMQAVIAADKGVEYGRVVDLIDLVKKNGITAFALDVERGTSATPVQTPPR
jgi:biopolymer transport protein ExbD